MTTLVKPSHKLTFRDRLSQLSFEQAVRLLGDEGRKMLIRGANREINIREQVYFGGDLLRVTFPSPAGPPEAIATLTLSPDARDRLRWNCDRCDVVCEHVGAMFSLILEYKTVLGLAAPPPKREKAIDLSEQAIVEQALADRRER